MTAATMDFTWINANGTTVALTPANGYDIQRGVLGLDVAPRVLTFDDLVGTDGALMSNTRYAARDVVLPIMTVSDRVLNEIHAAAVFFQGPGTLRYSDGTNVRELRNVYYSAGMEGDQSAGRAVTDYMRKYNVMLKALDPWWHGPDQTALLNFSGGAAPFDSPSIPFDDPLTPFDGGTTTGITVAGDTFAYPLLELHGPMNAGATVTLSGGEQFVTTGALTSTESLYVDSRPGFRGPRINTGEVDWSLLTPASRLFHLPVGSITLVADLSGDTGATFISVTWSERYLTP